jgi:hypothetical protein
VRYWTWEMIEALVVCGRVHGRWERRRGVGKTEQRDVEICRLKDV